MRSYLLLLILCIASTYAADAPNVIFWERSISMNITNTDIDNVGSLNQSSSYLTSCQDFQGIQIDSDSKSPPNRVVFNFGECCKSSNTTMEEIQTLNNNSIEAGGIIYAQKIALVKRGNCNWSEKLSVVNDLSTANGLNVTAMFIYDNDTHSTNISVEGTFKDSTGTKGPPDYSTSLPAVRNVANMSDNDLLISNPSSTRVYFIPFVYGETFIQRMNGSFDPNNPTTRKYWLLTPYTTEQIWGYPSGDGILSSGRGYLSYIIALGAIFIIGAIFLRWWKIRRMRADYPNGFNGFTAANVFGMQPRVNQLDPLPVDVVNSIPIAKYTDDLVKNVNCAICLEDFVPAKNDIRILPCAHGFCVLCIDPWLTQKSCMCPICKWDCLPADLRRERNEQHQRNRNAPQPANNDSQAENDSHVIDMAIPSSTNTTPELRPAENAATPPTTTPSPSNLTEKDRPHLQNPFESNASTISRHSGESSHPVPSTSPFADVDMASEKKSLPKD